MWLKNTDVRPQRTQLQDAHRRTWQHVYRRVTWAMSLWANYRQLTLKRRGRKIPSKAQSSFTHIKPFPAGGLRLCFWNIFNTKEPNSSQNKTNKEKWIQNCANKRHTSSCAPAGAGSHEGLCLLQLHRLKGLNDTLLETAAYSKLSPDK